jgi:hypothetical protein
MGRPFYRRRNIVLRAEVAREIVDQLAAQTATGGSRPAVHSATIVGDFQFKPGPDDL